MISNWTRQSEKLIFLVQLVSRILSSETLERAQPHTRTSITHPHNKTTYDKTPHHNIGDAGLAVVTSAAGRLESA